MVDLQTKTFTAQITKTAVFNLEYFLNLIYWVKFENICNSTGSWYFNKHDRIDLCETFFFSVVLQCHFYYCTLYVDITRRHGLQWQVQCHLQWSVSVQTNVLGAHRLRFSHVKSHHLPCLLHHCKGHFTQSPKFLSEIFAH